MSDENAAKVLLVDDQPSNLDVLCDLLESRGYSVLLAPSGSLALRTAVRAQPDLILLDVMMPDMDGFETCRRLKADPETSPIPVIFITALNQEADVIKGFDSGGVDFITKPFRDREVIVRVETHVRMNRLTRELESKNNELAHRNDQLQQEIEQRKQLKGQLNMISEREAEHWGLEEFVGESATIRKIFDDVKLMQENVGTSVLITGESGTGKELIARAIHFGSQRADAPFIPVNCNAIPGELVESTLFGHERGSFTGANAERAGCFELANGGTLFLDEIGDMPIEIQGTLLRVLEDGEVWRVGAKAGRKVDVRVVAATNADMQNRVAGGGFRQDLYYRLARFTVTAPPLRERMDDIPLLADHFIRMFSAEMARESVTLTEEAETALKAYPFPGNVRELKNIVERALIESKGGNIEPRHLHFLESTPAISSSGIATDLPMDLEKATQIAESRVLEMALAQTEGNLTEAAKLLGISRNRIYRIKRSV